MDRVSPMRAGLFGVILLMRLAPIASAGEAEDKLARGAKDVLKAYCYKCHGQDGRSEGGLNVVADLGKLVETKRVVPKQPESSKLLRRVLSGEMPPEEDLDAPAGKQAKLPRPTDDEIALLRSWVKAGAPTGQSGAPKPFISNDDIARSIRDDVEKLGPRDRKFARYFTLVHLANAGHNEDQLQSYRHGLSKLLNSLSWNRRISVPRPIDQARTILRIDLRDYLWDEPIWEAILKADPYAAFNDDLIARSLTELTGTQLPYIRADWFVHAASRPPLYEVVLRLPDTVQELESKIDVDVAANIRQDRVVRAGFNDSGISRNNRLLERHESTNGGYWRSYDFSGNADERNLFARPLGPGDGEHEFQHDGGESIFTLPNGLHGFYLSDAKGAKIDKGPTEIVRDAKQLDGAVVNGISCLSCHARGLLVKGDQVRDLVEKTGAFPKSVADTVMALYPGKEKLNELYKSDNESFAKAVARTGAALGPTEPVYALALQFESNLNLRLAAAESGLTVDEFTKLLKQTPPLAQALGPQLVGSTVKRDAFVATFPAIAEARQLTLVEAGAKPDVPRARTSPLKPGRPTASGKWIVLFKGRDPRAWNTRSEGSTWSRPLADLPAEIRYLRLRRLDTQDALIIPMSRERLWGAKSWGDDPASRVRWCGTNEVKWGGAHLGIAEGPRISGFDRTHEGECAVQVEFVDYFIGSGFGHIAHGRSEVQGFGWHGKVIEPTDFEISVSTSETLTPSERKQTLAASTEPGSASSRSSLKSSSRSGGLSSAPPPSRSSLGVKGKAYDSSRLEGLPPTIRWQNDDGFRDVATTGWWLVGLRFRVSKGTDGVVTAVCPIYSNGKVQTEGDWHGRGDTQEVVLVGRPGYAVGAIRTRTGLLLDGIQLVFMRVRGSALDPKDSYTSPLYGNPGGGQPTEVNSAGRPVVGIQGRATAEMHALGLVILK